MARKRGGVKKRKAQRSNEENENEPTNPINFEEKQKSSSVTKNENSIASLGEVGDDISDDVSDDMQDNSSEDGSDVEDEQEEQVDSDDKANPKYAAALTEDEVNHLRETEDLFKSNLLKLEIEELLKETQVKNEGSRSEKLKKLLFALKGELESIQEKVYKAKDLPIDIVQWKAKPLGDMEIDFSRPESVDIVGSYMTNTMVKPYKNVDFLVRMPSSCFQARDYLNWRYFNKRKMYLGVIAAKLKKKGEIFSKVMFESFLGDAEKPILVLFPNKPTGVKGYVIRIIPIVGDDLFPMRRFSPISGNVRKPGLDSENGETPQKVFPTPEYNMSILEDVVGSSFRSHMEIIHKVSNECDSFSKTVILLKIWTRQRGICNRSSPDSFNEFLLTMLLCHLLEERRLNRHMSCQQLFKSLMVFLSENDFAAANAPVMRMRLGNSQPLTIQGYEDEALKRAFKLVFMSACGKLNLAWRVSTSGWYAVQREAVSTLKLLNSAGADVDVGGRSSFEAMFISKIKFWQQFDRYIKVEVPSRPSMANLTGKDCERIASMGWDRYVWNKIEDVFSRGFLDTKRAKSIRICSRPSESRMYGLKSKAKKNKVGKNTSILVGLNLNLAHAFSLLDRGPPADDTRKAGEFRSFWGDKSELRRFKDGNILEAVLWESKDQDVNGDLCGSISKYLIKLHLSNLGKNHLDGDEHSDVVIASEFSGIVDKLGFRQRVRTVENIDTTQALLQTFESLQLRVRKLDLPLKVRSVTGADPSLRYAAAVLPTPHPLAFGRSDKGKDKLVSELEKKFVMSSRKVGKKSRKNTADLSVSKMIDAVDAVINFESSGKWPDDFHAINKMKTAFYIQIADALEKQFKGSQRCIVESDCLKVLLEGFAFRLRIRNDRQIDLLRGNATGNILAIQAAKTLQSKAMNAEDQLVSEMSIIKRKGFARKLTEAMVRKPLLHSQLHSLHTQIDSEDDEDGGAHVMSAVVQLSKLWIAGHRLWPCIKEEAVELIVASLFLHHKPYISPPRSAFSGFMRFLNLLATWEWKHLPLIVNLNGAMTPSDYTECMKQFTDQIEANPNRPPMYIITPDDVDTETINKKKTKQTKWRPFWTSKSQPSLPALERITKLAKASLEVLENLCSEQADIGSEISLSLYEALFRSDVDQAGHDIIIQLNTLAEMPETVSNIGGSNSSKKAKLSNTMSTRFFKNLAKETEKTVIVGIEPIEEYAKAIKEKFGHLFELFYDPIRGQDIGLNFHPSVKDPCKFRIAVASYSMPKESKNETQSFSHVVLNVKEIVADLAKMGTGLVQSISVNSM